MILKYLIRGYMCHLCVLTSNFEFLENNSESTFEPSKLEFEYFTVNFKSQQKLVSPLISSYLCFWFILPVIPSLNYEKHQEK